MYIFARFGIVFSRKVKKKWIQAFDLALGGSGKFRFPGPYFHGEFETRFGSARSGRNRDL